MSKKVIIIAVAAGLTSFAGAFATGWFTQPRAASGASEPAQPATAQIGGLGPAASAPSISPPTLSPTLAMSTDQATTARSMTEEQLKELILEVRDKIQEYNRRLQNLDKEKERLQVAQQTLKKDIETLNNLRVDLAASVADIKSERDMLLKTRVEVAAVEKANLIAIAAAYDKMDPVQASQILTNMAGGLGKSGNASVAANMDDAVKILFYMQDRTKGRVLAEMVSAEPALAALLSQKLKQVQEGK